MSKILERIVFIQVIEYLEENKLLHSNHHGFRSHHNTTTALVSMYDSWIEDLEKKEYSGVCMIDMSAAFDMVNHELLLRKFELYGFDNKSLNWIKSYLSDRKQCVSIDGIMSKFLEVTIGVPQGSILGPIFYIIYTNELPEIINNYLSLENAHSDHTEGQNCEECGEICCFADDSTLTCSGKTSEEIKEKLSINYNKISEYMSDNRLKLNGEKTHLMLMMTDQARRSKPECKVSIEIEGEDIEK